MEAKGREGGLGLSQRTEVDPGLKRKMARMVWGQAELG